MLGLQQQSKTMAKIATTRTTATTEGENLTRVQRVSVCVCARKLLSKQLSGRTQRPNKIYTDTRTHSHTHTLSHTHTVTERKSAPFAKIGNIDGSVGALTLAR